MKIVVCVKQVPDTNEVRIDPVKGTLIRDGVPSILNPDDANALEAALELKDRYEDVAVEVLTMGPVSYTHLDVYKRQMYAHEAGFRLCQHAVRLCGELLQRKGGRAVWLQRGLSGTVPEEPEGLCEPGAGPGSGSGAVYGSVSYTHLK